MIGLGLKRIVLAELLLKKTVDFSRVPKLLRSMKKVNYGLNTMHSIRMLKSKRSWICTLSCELLNNRQHRPNGIYLRKRISKSCDLKLQKLLALLKDKQTLRNA